MILRRQPLLAYFFLAYFLAWIFWVPVLASTRGWIPFNIPIELYWLAGPSAISAGVIMTYVDGGKAGLKDLLRRMLLWKFDITWYILILLLPIFIRLVTLLIFHFTGGALPTYDWLHVGQVLFTGILLFPLALFEEVGWRGYALPKLLTRFTPLAASLILGLLHMLWHLPLSQISAITPDSSPYNSGLEWAIYLVGGVALTIFFTFIFKNTHGSILAACLFHSVTNYSMQALTLPAAGTDIRIQVIDCLVSWAAVLIILLVFGPQLSRSDKNQMAAHFFKK